MSQRSPLAGLNPKDWGLAELIVGVNVAASYRHVEQCIQRMRGQSLRKPFWLSQ